ncbi:hypothetical protein V1279_003065 [Bradyrhizobium sp. AZCC 1610]|uniref:hypothetical protein n=1 Tax=Bradyrhizobium sp. AZCC 1610 TaxID=3117020 RepID=UPI002FEEF545
MVLPTSGAVAFSSVNGEFGRGISGSNYYGVTYYKLVWNAQFGVWVPASGTFPSSSFAMSNFYGTSPDDEWNCACNCDCMCGK